MTDMPTIADRRRMLAIAMDNARVTLHVRVLIMMIYDATGGGLPDAIPMQRSYRELAQRPWGLCCGRTTARQSVVDTVAAGFIKVEPQTYSSGGTAPNSYRIDWDGIRSMIALHEVTASTYPINTESAYA